MSRDGALVAAARGEDGEKEKRDDVDDLDQRVDRGARGVLVGIADRVAGDRRLVRVGALAAVVAVLDVFLGVVPGAAARRHRDGDEEAGDDGADQQAAERTERGGLARDGAHDESRTIGAIGPVTGQRVQFNIIFTTAINLPADHYFFVPQVQLANGDFFWLSSPRPIVPPGTPLPPGFTDLQGWARNGDLDPDWLRSDKISSAAIHSRRSILLLQFQALLFPVQSPALACPDCC